MLRCKSCSIYFTNGELQCKTCTSPPRHCIIQACFNFESQYRLCNSHRKALNDGVIECVPSRICLHSEILQKQMTSFLSIVDESLLVRPLTFLILGYLLLSEIIECAQQKQSFLFQAVAFVKWFYPNMGENNTMLQQVCVLENLLLPSESLCHVEFVRSSAGIRGNWWEEVYTAFLRP